MYKVLVVDDEKYVRKSIINRIDWRSLGLTICDEAENGSDALKKIKELKPDIVLVDVMMPIMNGIELISQLRPIFPELFFIILSGYDDFKYTKPAIRFGVSNYIKKPIDEKELTETLCEIISKLENQKKRANNIDEIESRARLGMQAVREKHMSELLFAGVRSDYSATTLKGDTLCLVMLFLQNKSTNEIKIRDCMGLLEKFFLFEMNTRKLYSDNICILHEKHSDYVLFNLLISADNLDNTIMDEMAVELMEKRHDVGISQWAPKIAYSDIFNDISDAHRFYLQVKNIIKYKLVVNHKLVLSLETINEFRSEKQERYSPISISDYLIIMEGALAERDSERLVKAGSGIFDRLKSESFTIEVIESVLAQLQSFIKRHSVSMNAEEHPVFAQDYILKFNSIDDLSENVALVFKEFASKLPENMNESVTLKAKKFIEREYATQMTTQTVAEKFFMNSNYLSQLFKTEYGFSISTYIETVRLEHAKVLLEHNFSLQKTAETVGYNDANYFGKVFKKRFGMSPGKFIESKMDADDQ